MAGVAFLLNKRGCKVSGCDLYSTARTEWLVANGIAVTQGHSAEHIKDIDELIVTPAVPKDAPELLAARAQGVSIRMRGEVLAELFNAADGIAVCGTHGKTTTATFIKKLLMALGAQPAWCIGGECGAMNVAGVGSGPLVVEADESDGTLALYKAKTLVITSLEYDHPDYFKTYDDYLECFRKASHAAEDVIESEKLPVGDWPELTQLVVGEHNVHNARAAVEVALRRGFTREQILAALPTALAELPDRRFELVTESCGVKVYNDYAHHPTELKCAVAMARSVAKRGAVKVIFQPHRYSRTKSLLNEFAPAFDMADEVVLTPVYAAFEQPLIGGDIADLYVAFRARGKVQTLLARSADEAWRHELFTARPDDVVLLVGAGDIPAKLSARAKLSAHFQPFVPRTQLAPYTFFRCGGVTVGGGACVAVGAGSNMWFSDCVSDVELITAPAGRLSERTFGAGTLGAEIVRVRKDAYFMAGVPGTIGGWVAMNAGAFGHAFGELVQSVTFADGVTRAASEMEFGYRHSAVTRFGTITTVTLKEEIFTGGTAVEILSRRKKFPPRTCGSVFKNPPDDAAGRLLEAVGAKNLRIGGAYVWQEHANVIVAGEGCTASDILALSRIMSARVYEKFGIMLKLEIRGIEE